MRARLQVLVRLCAAFGAAVFMFCPAICADAAKQTQFLVFMPWTSSGLQHGFGITSRLRGLCWTRSIATNRPDAWRCTAGNDIYDPCFLRPGQGDQVVCAQTPFSRSLVFMRLSKPLGTEHGAMLRWLQHKGEPWAVRLENGDKCALITGATEIVDGKRLNYVCVRSGWIAGFPDRASGTVWTVQVLADPTEKRLDVLRVTTAVF